MTETLINRGWLPDNKSIVIDQCITLNGDVRLTISAKITKNNFSSFSLTYYRAEYQGSKFDLMEREAFECHPNDWVPRQVYSQTTASPSINLLSGLDLLHPKKETNITAFFKIF